GAGASLVEDPNRRPKKPRGAPEPAEATCTEERGGGAILDSEEARSRKLPVGASAVSAGGLTCAGIVPEAVWMTLPGPPWDFTAAMKGGFMPPSMPMVTWAVGVPRLTSSAVLLSSRP